jgi:sugar lactone lactonase YvrE
MTTDVTVATDGRIFVDIPRWGDEVPYTVGEIRHGEIVPYPDAAINAFDPAHPATTFGSVQSVVVDPANRLWILDTAAPSFSAPVPGGAKLVAVDRSTDTVVKTIVLAPKTILKTTYVNDVRFDPRQGEAGIATSPIPPSPGWERSSPAITSATASGNARPMASGRQSRMIPAFSGRMRFPWRQTAICTSRSLSCSVRSNSTAARIFARSPTRCTA